MRVVELRSDALLTLVVGRVDDVKVEQDASQLLFVVCRATVFWQCACRCVRMRVVSVATILECSRNGTHWHALARLVTQ